MDFVHILMPKFQFWCKICISKLSTLGLECFRDGSLYKSNPKVLLHLTNCFFSPDKLAPDGPAMAKYRKAKRFDPTKSDVLQVLNEQEKGEYCVDKKAVIEARLDQQCNGVS